MSASYMSRSLRIVRLANFVAPASGGLRTALRELGAGYRAAGHDPVLIIPGKRAGTQESEQGTVITLPGPLLPGTGGYRVLTDRRRLARLLHRLAPDRLEVSDRTTLRWTGAWARRARVPAVMVSHETAHGVLRTWGAPEAVARRAADVLNARTAWAYSRVVCTTEWAEREFVRIGARNVVRAPLGVDLVSRHPRLADPGLRKLHADADEILLVLCSRLSIEKRPGTALDALASLRSRGVRVHLVVAGDGPLKSRLEQSARQRRLPATFLGHVEDRDTLGALQASADACLAPGPAETFGLAALEALACGTPVVVSASSALPQIVGTAGVAAADNGHAFADAVLSILDRPEADRRHAARARAETFGWDVAVAAFLRAHDATSLPTPPPVQAVGGSEAAHARAVPAGGEGARTHSEVMLLDGVDEVGGGAASGTGGGLPDALPGGSGPAGVSGPAGEPGPAGVSGSAGVPGSLGGSGQAGVAGSLGGSGQAGVAGSSGACGPSGVRGPLAEPGPDVALHLPPEAGLGTLSAAGPQDGGG